MVKIKRDNNWKKNTLIFFKTMRTQRSAIKKSKCLMKRYNQIPKILITILQMEVPSFHSSLLKQIRDKINRIDKDLGKEDLM